MRHHTIIGGRALVVDGRIALTRYSIVIVTLIIMHCRNETVGIFLAVMVYVLMYYTFLFYNFVNLMGYGLIPPRKTFAQLVRT